MRSSPDSHAGVPTGAVAGTDDTTPVILEAELNPLSVLYEDGTGEAYLKLKITQRLEWVDYRLANPLWNPCKKVHSISPTPHICPIPYPA